MAKKAPGRAITVRLPESIDKKVQAAADEAGLPAGIYVSLVLREIYGGERLSLLPKKGKSASASSGAADLPAED